MGVCDGQQGRWEGVTLSQAQPPQLQGKCVTGTQSPGKSGSLKSGDVLGAAENGLGAEIAGPVACAPQVQMLT